MEHLRRNGTLQLGIFIFSPNTIEMSQLGPAHCVSSFLPGSVFHSHLPFCYAVGSAHTWCYPARSDGRDHLLPLPWHLSPFRPTSKSTHTTYGAVPIHYFLHIETCMYTRVCLTFSGVDGCWHSDLLLICNQPWVPNLSWKLQHIQQRLLQVSARLICKNYPSLTCIWILKESTLCF